MDRREKNLGHLVVVERFRPSEVFRTVLLAPKMCDPHTRNFADKSSTECPGTSRTTRQC